MLKSDLVALLVSQRQLSEKQAERAVDAIFKAMQDALVRGENIELRGFGSFLQKDYPAYTGRNPKTEKPILVPAKRGILFRTGKELRLRVDRGSRLREPASPAPQPSKTAGKPE